jgi:DNA recombination protein RmuC
MPQLTEQQFFILAVLLSGLLGMLVAAALAGWQQRRENLRQHSAMAALQQRLEEQALRFHQQDTEVAVLRQQGEQLQVGLAQAQDEKTLLQAQKESLHQALQRARTDLEKMRLESDKDRQHLQEKLEQLVQDRETLKKEFEQLAQQTLKATQQEFSQHSRQGLEDFLKPFRQQVADFRSKVETIHSDDLKQREALRSELKQLQALNVQITREAHELSTALKGQKKTQGNWGELILENVLDRSGLRRDQDYRREVSFSTAEGRKRPDVIVYLPQQRHLVIDAKVSLNAYTRYINADNEIERAQALKEHVQALTQRIQELSSKNYFELPGLSSPEMVFMFVPIESAFVEAIKADEGLFQMAIEQHILVTTPTTLLTSLNIVRQLWRFEDQNKHAARLADQAAKVYNQLRLFLESMEALGEQLERSRKSYEMAMNQFVSGRGNLVKRVEDFRKLGVAVKKEMPAKVVDKAGLELQLIEHPKADA